METLGDAKNSQKQPIFCCKICDYISSKKSNYKQHLSTQKHKVSLVGDGGDIQVTQKKAKNSQFICPNCSKHYQSRNGLWKHKKICQSQMSDNITITENDKFDKDVIISLLKQNSELIELIKKGTTNISNNHINNSNNTFNLNMYLQETCKDAMNIDEFVSSIKLSLEDLEHTGKRGYVEGISNIFIKNLNNLENHLRPLHCSDAKREIIYIKENDQWIKETEQKPILTNAIKTIANENIKQIKVWKDLHPGCTLSDSKKNNTYLQIVGNCMIGITTEDCVNNVNKIISNISKAVVINKHLHNK